MKKILLTILTMLTLFTTNITIETCLADNFAKTAIFEDEDKEGYTPGTDAGYFTDDTSALRELTVKTNGDSWYVSPLVQVPVVPVYAAFRTTDIVTVGSGKGELIVKFDHPVMNDPFNPYGVDFLIFGNAFQSINEGSWPTGNPSLVTLGWEGWAERGWVEVSQDGKTWTPFSAGPYADDFAPTLGQCYDPVNPDPSLGAWNLWWGSPTDPTLPLPPSLSFERFQGKTLKTVAEVYGQSAGGTGFDLSDVGLDWIQYVRITASPDGGTPEIDAIVAVAPRVPGDANLDGVVDVGDLGILAANYGSDLAGWNMGDFTGDGCVDVGDLGVLAANYGHGVNHRIDFSTDHAKVFGTAQTVDDSHTPFNETQNGMCSIPGLPILVTFFVAGLMLMKLDT